ncbi:MAG: cellulase family glycosylhydrolase [Candidatus Hydrogenedentes bacterium]|nr:cellulase family glycosylhydrolase [Candidatus Hydrogenedentota bacterium]
MVCVSGWAAPAAGAAGAPGARPVANRAIIVDDAGVLRWEDTGGEVALFGVNYYAPHCLNYHDLKALGLNIEEVIDRDLAHLERMGLDALRLHVFDREISDRQGNLLDNEHLRLLDYLVTQAKARGFYTVLTPIAWWGSPNPHDGFSDTYTMREMTTDPEAWKAQEAYLAQFVCHVNRYTGLAYKDDPAVPAFELINEPLYPEGTSDEEVCAYINALAGAVRATGCRKPLFFNGWTGREAAVGDAHVDGCTFGWYPTGLVAGHALRGNFLPRVDRHPTMSAPELAGKARIVYEFDSADVAGGYLYPAMARAFRTGGAQIATQFQYDPLPVAPFNLGWQTHFLNLVYAPGRAVGFMVACEAFHRIPRGTAYGNYPENAQFGPFRVSYEEDLAEWATATDFMYSNTTATRPPDAASLERIVGCGSSPVVEYEGTGAYFVERLEPGVWRLEVYPDAVWVDDPFGRDTGFDRECSRVLWRTWPMTLRLPDLGPAFAAEAIDARNAFTPAPAEGGRLLVRPGVYLLHRAGIAVPAGLREAPCEFIAPPPSDAPAALWHEPAAFALEGAPVDVAATLAAPDTPGRVTLFVRGHGEGAFRPAAMNCAAAYRYAYTIPANWLPAGDAEYFIAVQAADVTRVFPSGAACERPEEGFRLPAPWLLFEAAPGLPMPEVATPGAHAATAALAEASGDSPCAVRLRADGFEEGGCSGLRLPVLARPQGDGGDAAWPGDWEVVITARSLVPETTAVEIGLVEADGSAYGFDAPIAPDWGESRTRVSELRPLWDTSGKRLRVDRVQSVSVVYGAWLFRGLREQPHGLEIARVRLEPIAPVWRVPVLPRNAAVALFDAERHHVNPRAGQLPCHTALVPGAGGKHQALRIAVDGFEAPPSSVAFWNSVEAELDARRGDLERVDRVVVRARAYSPATNAIEIALIERDGSVWGANAGLTTAWQDVAVPLSALRFFSHWPGNPADRGGEGDRLDPANLAAVNVCFGAWLYREHAGQRHVVTIERILLDGPGE